MKRTISLRVEVAGEADYALLIHSLTQDPRVTHWVATGFGPSLRRLMAVLSIPTQYARGCTATAVRALR